MIARLYRLLTVLYTMSKYFKFKFPLAILDNIIYTENLIIYNRVLDLTNQVDSQVTIGTKKQGKRYIT